MVEDRVVAGDFRLVLDQNRNRLGKFMAQLDQEGAAQAVLEFDSDTLSDRLVELCKRGDTSTSRNDCLSYFM